ncbi:hypothetical protein LTR91_010224 [Friedmanniomyces endolithicus]|uniref:UBA domain-containing protein n=1 Tax=Friedmanniomyces endolithicus TaxID=329885 RepID=A0AAN6QTR6_9PEZI|nr:hypothetical protein LTS00_011868 [Friedmanniomyces endolithicus]KAK0986509.1 hypothetical protein LTR91_010224 [Friedmanniomyces endolithicus]KAK1035926.1 hypothetical protein LTS16_014192 [Friedmanniomyces endolithicus]
MAETQFASLNGATAYVASMDLDDMNFDFQPDSKSMARRSISIFSRRGTETPEPKPPFIAQAAMAKTPVVPLKREMTERQKSWLGRRRSMCGSSNTAKTSAPPKKPMATVLNAVPRAKKISMTALEEEMATSPNDEILSALSESSVTQAAFLVQPQPPPQHSPILQGGRLGDKRVGSLHQQRPRGEKRDENSRIGLWVNGVAQWDDHLPMRNHQHSQWVEEAISQETHFMPLHPAATPTNVPLAIGGSRPSLLVRIPHGSESKANTMALSTVIHPKPQQPVVSLAPASIVSKFNIAAPAIFVTEDIKEKHEVSPIDSVQQTLPPGRLTVVSPVSLRPKPSRESSSSAGSYINDSDDKSSVYSKHSSATSVEDLQIPIPVRSKKRLSGRALTSRTPSTEDISAQQVADLNKPLPPNPHPLPPRSAPIAPALQRRTRTSGSVRSVPGHSKPTPAAAAMQRPFSMVSPRTHFQLDQLDSEFMRCSPYASPTLQEPCLSGPGESDTDGEREPVTPTLSQAEDELHAQLQEQHSLEARAKDKKVDFPISKSTSIRRSDSVRSVMQPPARAPTVPRRSRKREWRTSRIRPVLQYTAPERRKSESTTQSQHKQRRHQDMAASMVRRTASAAQFTVARVSEVPSSTYAEDSPPKAMPRIIFDDGLIAVQGPTIVSVDGEVLTPTALAAASAEDVLLHILSSLTTLDDLFNTASVNKGMHRVFKENEMHLVRTVCLNQSPAAWEFREWSPPDRNESDTSSKASSQLEHTPQSYIRCHKRDIAVLESLKALIVAHCQTFIRRDTTLALRDPSHPSAQRFDNAIWRIWCFCKIFGCDKGREDDITGQLDWLKGGLLANNQGCVATVNTNLEFDMSSVLLNAPDHFAAGNAGGLTSQQLYDMTEIWGCLSALLQGYQGRVDQARAAGVFDGCVDVEEGDEEKEEQMLEEWIHHLLTLGPTTVLEMAEYAADPSAAGFTIAKLNGWTKWTPPAYTGSRVTFLKEPVARLYEERVAATALAIEHPSRKEKSEVSRKRVANLAAEIRLKRQTSNYMRSPYIDMSLERTMSGVSRRASTMSTSSRDTQRSLVSPMTPAQRYSYGSGHTSAVSAVQNSSHPHPQPQEHVRTSSGQWSPRKISPIIEERVDSFNRLSLQNLNAGEADNTSDRAVKKIVEMGFTAEQAKEALRMTDMGDGLRVDRAVDLLLRQRH